MMKSKRGEEIVEAAIVLSIIILTILSLITLLIYFYSCLNSQIDLHEELINDSTCSVNSIKKIEKSRGQSKGMGGVVTLIMSKEITDSIYCIKESKLIRMGGLFSGDD